MKFFLDLSPAFAPQAAAAAIGPAAAAARWTLGLAEAALDDERVYFQLGDTLLPRAFVAWTLENDWEGGAHLRKLADGRVQLGRLALAVEKRRAGALASIGVGLAPPADDAPPWDHRVRLVDDVRSLDPAAALAGARACDLACCLSEPVWRDYVALFAAERVAPAIVTPAAAAAPGGAGRAPPPAATDDAAAIVLLGRGREGLWESLATAPIAFAFGASPTGAPPSTSVRAQATPAELRVALAGARAVVAASALDPIGLWSREAELFGTPVIAPIGSGAAAFCDARETRRVDPTAPSAMSETIDEIMAQPWTPEDRAALAARARRGEDWRQAGARILAATTALIEGRF